MTVQNINNGKVVKRVPKDAEHIYGIVDADNIPIDIPCIVAIGGGKSTTRRHANYYASALNKLFVAHNIDGVSIYSAYKSYVDTNRKDMRAKIFKIAQSLVPGHFDITNETEYIRDLYQHIIFPRIVNHNGTYFSDAEAAKNLHLVILFTHCHGAAIVRVFQDMMLSDMLKYGYKKQAIPQIMKQLLVVQHAPLGPLTRSLFNTVSFMSANDPYVYTNFDNAFAKYASVNSGDMLPSYFTAGNLFAATALTTKNMTHEHDLVDFSLDIDSPDLSPDGKIIITAERNTIINGAKSMNLPDLVPLSAQQLIAPISKDDKVKPNFNELKTNGDAFMAMMKNDIKQEYAQTNAMVKNL